MVAVELPVAVASVVVALVLGYLCPRIAPVPEGDGGDAEREAIGVTPIARIGPRRSPTGLHCVEYSDTQESRVLYEGPSEAAARDAWETISTQHPVPEGSMTWWRPDGSLRGSWGQV